MTTYVPYPLFPEEDRKELLASVREAQEAIVAFGQYCNTYQNHGLSPRLVKWLEASDRLLAAVDPKP